MATKEKVYTPEEIAEKLKDPALAGWYLEDGWLRRKYNSDGWGHTMMAVNAIAFLCEAADHHADIAISWGKFWVKLCTHSAGGITDKDFELAVKIEEITLWRPKGGALAGCPDKFIYSK